MIQLSEGRVATIFINPPVMVQPTGGYARMSARKIESTDINALIEDTRSGIGVELCKLDLKNLTTNIDYENDNLMAFEKQKLMRLSVSLLYKFGVIL